MLHPYKEHAPVCAPGARAAENATVLGDVSLGRDANIWFGAVVRGDMAPISVGDRSNIQDNAVAHVDDDHPLRIGENVTVGHGAILHGCTVEDGCLIGMGAILLNGCVIGRGSLVAAGALVTQGKLIPPGSLVMGAPAKVVRALTEEELTQNRASADGYVELSRQELPEARGGAQ